MGFEPDRWTVGRARQRIIHERAGHELAVALVIDRLLHQRLANALHGAAVHLARQHQRIERDAEVIDDHVVHHPDHAGGRVDLDLGHVRAIRESAVGTAELLGRGQLCGIDACALGQIGERDGAVGTRDANCAIDDLKIAGTGFQSLRRDLLQAGACLLYTSRCV